MVHPPKDPLPCPRTPPTKPHLLTSESTGQTKPSTTPKRYLSLLEGTKERKTPAYPSRYFPSGSDSKASAYNAGDPATVHGTNQWLTELEFSETKLEALALKLLRERLKDPNCKVQKLKLSASFLLGSSETIGRYLASVLICNPNFTELDLSENLLGDTGVKFLRDGLRHSNCKVEKQELWTCHLTGECCQHSCNSLYTNGHLRVLELSASALGDEGMQLFCEGLKRPSCKLQTLRVHHEKRPTGRNTSWNQDCREKYQ
ncbi:hypothetical protein ABFV05_019973 [Capra hircus]